MLLLSLVGTYLYNDQEVLNHIPTYLRNVAPTLDPKFHGSNREPSDCGDPWICRFTLDFHRGL